MGNAESGTYQKRLSRIPLAEQTEIEKRFENLCVVTSSTRKRVGRAVFQDSFQDVLPGAMSQRIFRGIQSVNVTGKPATPSAEVSKEQFALFLADVLRGTAEEKSALVIWMIGDGEPLTGQQVQQFLEDLIGSVVHALCQEESLRGWSLEHAQDCGSGTRILASQLLSQLLPADSRSADTAERLKASFSRGAVEDWLYKVPLVSVFLRVVVTLGLSVLRHSSEHQKDLSSLVPRCTRGKSASFSSLLDLPSVMFLNSVLPSGLQSRWRLLFSTQIHGESFSQLCGRLVDQGPSLLVLRDSDGAIFGGFASRNWEVKPQYQGDGQCFLFTVSPWLEVFTYTGYNDHYMYLNHGQQTMPNGLGMGGQHHYFGLWIDSHFGKGHSKAKPRCTTYNSPQLSAQEEFTIDCMEVWALGEPPEHLLAKTKKSILDVDPEARALLEMTGRTRQSDGLRDKGEEEED